MRFIKQLARQAFRVIDPGLIYGREYHAIGKRLSNLQIETFGQLEELERSFLWCLFQRISRTVPYYRHLRQFRVGWEDEDPKKILLDLPLLTKEMIQDDVERFTSETVPLSKRRFTSTGGSTAAPVGFYEVRRRSEAIETAYIHHLWSRVGYHRTQKSAVFRGIVVKDSEKDPLWKYEPYRRAMIYSAYHLNGADMESIYDHLCSFNPRFIQAYPSAANLLAVYIEESGKYPPSNLKAVLLGSENLPAWQRERIEQAFGAPVYSWYGHAEKAVLAGEIPGSAHLYVVPTYGYMYLLSDVGKELTDPGLPGEIIATGFTNSATHFVNYRTGDIGVWADPGRVEQWPSHGVCRVLERVEGRAQELAITESGRRISMASINMHSDIFSSVKQFRFVQNRRGSIRLEIVRKRDFTPEDDRRIREGIQRKFGADMSLEVIYRDSLPRARSGKARFLIQNVKQDDS
jgi:phenylacetate-CoA ligase